MDEFYFDGLLEQAEEAERPEKPNVYMAQDGASGISALVDAYQQARDRKERLEAELKEAKKREADLKGMLIDAMLEDETDSIGRNGRKYTVVEKTKYAKKAGAEEELWKLLREKGLGDIIQETVNANTLSAAMNQMADGDPESLGEEWQECLNIYTYTDISVRKG